MTARLSKLYSAVKYDRSERAYGSKSSRSAYSARAFNRADRKAARLAAFDLSNV